MITASFKHVEYLATVLGGRGSATPNEKKAHVHCHAALKELGYEVNWHEFHAPVSGWRQCALAQALLLLAVLIFWGLGSGVDRQAGALAAAVLGLIVTVSFFLHLTQRDNPLAWFQPTAPSQNVWAIAPPAQREAVRHQIVIMAHVDTHRALPANATRNGRVLHGLALLLAGVALVLVGLFTWGIFSPAALPRTIAVCLTPLPVMGLIFATLADREPYVAGGITNAAAVGVLLALAERLKQAPPAHTEVYLVVTGSAAVGGYGAIEWLREQQRRLTPNAGFIVLDHVGGALPQNRYLLAVGRRLHRTGDRCLLDAAAGVAHAHAELTTIDTPPLSLIPELAVCRNHGRPAIGLLSLNPQTGLPLHYCSPADDMTAIEPAALDWLESIIWELLQKLERECAP